MGILNVTPDSFSDGGAYFDPALAVEHAAEMIAEGADIIDVGGESTRPRATAISADDEQQRVIPVVRELARRFPRTIVSIDTVKAATAAAALGAGARIVNDVSGFRLDSAMAPLCAREKCGVILMHSRGTVSTMASYELAEYDDVIGQVVAELRTSLETALAAGIDADAVVLDPGLGFSKRAEHSLAAIAAVPAIAALGRPVMIGASRKRFLGDLTGVREPSARQYGTIGANVAGLLLGARLFRVHDVAPTRQALDVAWAVMQAAAAR
jgi:dihydropteroate synthase